MIILTQRLATACSHSIVFLNIQYFSEFSGESHEPLSWGLRIQIALDVARGLEYLHDGVSFEFSNAATCDPVSS